MTSSSAGTRTVYATMEELFQRDPTNTNAVEYLALWHLERCSFLQARKYLGQLASLRRKDPDVWMELCICCALAGETEESAVALREASKLVDNPTMNIRMRFCQALVFEKRRDYALALNTYLACLEMCSERSRVDDRMAQSAAIEGKVDAENAAYKRIASYKELRGDVMLRIASIKKETRDSNQALKMCQGVIDEHCDGPLHAAALVLQGSVLETLSDLQGAEGAYRAALQAVPDHFLALERLARVYLRFPETIHVALELLFCALDCNPASPSTWYLLGRCYMASGQAHLARDTYLKALNLDPNEAPIWASLGVLYCSSGQYPEAVDMCMRALHLDGALIEAWYNMGVALDLMDLKDAARFAFDSAKALGLPERLSGAGIAVSDVTAALTSATGQ